MMKTISVVLFIVSILLMGFYFKNYFYLKMILLKKRKKENFAINNKRLIYEKIYLKKILFVLEVLFNLDKENAKKKIANIYLGVVFSIVILIIVININFEVTTFLRTILFVISIFYLYNIMIKLTYIRYYNQIFRFYCEIHNLIITDENMILNVNKIAKSKKKNYVSREIKKFYIQVQRNENININKNIQENYEYTGNYELGQIFYLIYNSYLCGGRKKLLSDVSELERQALVKYETNKEYMSQKIPYLVILLVIPFLLFFRKSFLSGMYENFELKNTEPIEIVFILTVIFSLILLSLKET